MLLTMFLYAVGLYFACGVCTIVFDTMCCNTDTALTAKKVFGIKPLNGSTWRWELERFLIMSFFTLLFWPVFVLLYKAK